MKNALMITYVFPPHAGAGVQRTLKFAKYLPDSGWNPIVLTIKPYDWKGKDATLLDEIPSWLEFHRCFSLELRRLPNSLQGLLTSRQLMRARRLFEVPDHCVGWLPFAMARIRRIISKEKIDLVYSSFPPATAHLIAYLTKKKYRLPWVADYRDPWTHHPWRKAARVYRGLHRRMEKEFLRSADANIVTARKLKDDLILRYPDLSAKSIHTITNGYDEEDFSGVNTPQESSPFKIVYTGASLGAERLRYFAEALRRLVANGLIPQRDLQVIFVGCADGPTTAPDPEMKIEAVTCSNVGYVSHQQSIEHLMKADVLLLYSWGKNVIPGKTFEYLRAKKPILCLARQNDELADFIGGTGAGPVVPPDDVTLIAGTLLDLYGKRNSTSQHYSASESFIARYERKALTSDLANIFNELTS